MFASLKSILKPELMWVLACAPDYFRMEIWWDELYESYGLRLRKSWLKDKLVCHARKLIEQKLLTALLWFMEILPLWIELNIWKITWVEYSVSGQRLVWDGPLQPFARSCQLRSPVNMNTSLVHGAGYPSILPFWKISEDIETPKWMPLISNLTSTYSTVVVETVEYKMFPHELLCIWKLGPQPLLLLGEVMESLRWIFIAAVGHWR